jgi:NADH:ubiquinone oxidoreductase subunit 4 (subunit M)
MFQRIFFGEVSPFLAGLGDHLFDITPVEILTLAPLAAMVIAFGLFPGILLNIVNEPILETLAEVQTAHAIAIQPAVVAIGVGIVVLLIVVRLVSLRPANERSSGSTAPVVVGDAAR